MLKVIGGDNFKIKKEGGRDWEYGRYNKLFLIESCKENSGEYLYVNDTQIDELIDLLHKAKELL